MNTIRDVVVQIDDRVATVEIRRAPHNYFDHGLIRALADAYESIDADPGARAIVLCSDGRSFCAGADFGAREAWGPDELREQAARLYREAVRLFRTRTPVVAAVQGAAIGGGLGLALSADFRIAAPQARFSANFARLGLYPGFGITETLQRVVGPVNADLLLFTGRRAKADEALAMGLVSEVVAGETLRERAHALAREIALSAPLSIDRLRGAARAALADAVARATEHELAVQTELKSTADFEEGVRAMAERREPRFEGR